MNLLLNRNPHIITKSPLFYWLLDFKIHSDTKNFFKNAQKIIKEKTEKNVIKKPTEKLPKNK